MRRTTNKMHRVGYVSQATSNFWASVLVAGELLLTESVAHAQVQGDVSVQAGAAKRFLSGGDLDGEPGPVVEARVAVEVARPIRVGAYVDYELAPTGEPASPSIVSFGLRAEASFVPPLHTRLRYWFFVGVGDAIVIAPPYSQVLTLPNPATGQLQDQNTFVQSAGGNFVELPFGLGGGWRAWRSTELVAELAGRPGFGFSGSYYDPNGRSGSSAISSQPLALNPAGNDVFGVLLTVGAALDF